MRSPPVPHMRAVQYERAGDASVLQLVDHERPTPRRDEVLVAVRAASVNPVDVKRRELGTGPLPKVTGSDFAGEVIAVGEAVEGFSPGDRVCGTGLHTPRFQQGSFAEYVCVPTDVLVQLPGAISYADAAAVALTGVTVWRGLLDHGRLRPTDTCLVHGGTGGVGHLAVQLASHVGATVVATAAPDRMDAAAGFGADTVLSYRHEDLPEALAAAAPDGYDVVFDHRPGEYLETDARVTKFAGRIIIYSGLDTDCHLPMTALYREQTIQLMTMSNLVTRPTAPTVASVLRRIIQLVHSGDLTVSVARTFPLEKARAAHRAVMEDSYVGKLVVTP